MTDPVRVGIVGCGVIANAYAAKIRSFPHLDLVACADQSRFERNAGERAAAFHLRSGAGAPHRGDG